jgi:hypothetical protein
MIASTRMDKLSEVRWWQDLVLYIWLCSREFLSLGSGIVWFCLLVSSNLAVWKSNARCSGQTTEQDGSPGQIEDGGGAWLGSHGFVGFACCIQFFVTFSPSGYYQAREHFSYLCRSTVQACPIKRKCTSMPNGSVSTVKKNTKNVSHFRLVAACIHVCWEHSIWLFRSNFGSARSDGPMITSGGL